MRRWSFGDVSRASWSKLNISFVVDQISFVFRFGAQGVRDSGNARTPLWKSMPRMKFNDKIHAGMKIPRKFLKEWKFMQKFQKEWNSTLNSRKNENSCQIFSGNEKFSENFVKNRELEQKIVWNYWKFAILNW